ncbi:AmmeMemoRadiSam system radical SAM enzyme [Mangrovibacterium marinum]|uniref:Pyruvate formate lyase activating enzyme n=1 Tax=Mangrovibacterium marinum TaxID=1639118 RepID=A0A2T5BZE7_9BACT|nr:AmmeMemoRadiSam system radical SAM enzyme [Mangrovibacterium marinum]PTN07660.1 pyruvate formate lyase activating enzyme [Mangrovibacterium marinum]
MVMGAGGIAYTGSEAFGEEKPSSGIKNKWTHEALFYTETPKGIRCLICPNECDIKEGETGDCRNRINKGGVLYSMAYGNPCAVHIDPIEKKPLLHFLPGSTALSIATAGCNLACLNCQNWTISQKSPADTDNQDLMPDKVVQAAIDNHCASVAYTYTEPITFYEYTYDTSVLARQAGVKNVMVTAGYINKEPLLKLCKVIDAANVDLKSFSNDIYLKLNAGKLDTILNTLVTMKDEGVWLEITNLVVPSWTDDLDMIKRMCGWLMQNGFENYPLHFSRFHPTYKLTQLPPTPVTVLQSARDIAVAEGLHHVYIGNVPGLGAENTICPNCHQLVVERKGYRITQQHLNDGRCEFCDTPVSGVW